MRLTLVLNHGKRYYWGKGWGNKPGRDKTNFLFKEQWKAKSKRQIFECYQTLPPNAAVEDANQFVKNCLNQEFKQNSDDGNRKEYPWPHSQRPLKSLTNH